MRAINSMSPVESFVRLRLAQCEIYGWVPPPPGDWISVRHGGQLAAEQPLFASKPSLLTRLAKRLRIAS